MDLAEGDLVSNLILDFRTRLRDFTFNFYPGKKSDNGEYSCNLSGLPPSQTWDHGKEQMLIYYDDKSFLV